MQRKLTFSDVALTGVAAAALVAVQVALSALPNVELVTLLVILYARHFGKKALFAVYVFVLLEGLIWGFHLWWISYLYVWTVLYFAARALKAQDSPLFFAIAAAIYGMLFGTLTAIPTFVLFGPSAGAAYMLANFPFDLAHCAGNFLTVLLLFRPLDLAFSRLTPDKKI